MWREPEGESGPRKDPRTTHKDRPIVGPALTELRQDVLAMSQHLCQEQTRPLAAPHSPRRDQGYHGGDIKNNLRPILNPGVKINQEIKDEVEAG